MLFAFWQVIVTLFGCVTSPMFFCFLSLGIPQRKRCESIVSFLASIQPPDELRGRSSGQMQSSVNRNCWSSAKEPMAQRAMQGPREAGLTGLSNMVSLEPSLQGTNTPGHLKRTIASGSATSSESVLIHLSSLINRCVF